MFWYKQNILIFFSIFYNNDGQPNVIFQDSISSFFLVGSRFNISIWTFNFSNFSRSWKYCNICHANHKQHNVKNTKLRWRESRWVMSLLQAYFAFECSTILLIPRKAIDKKLVIFTLLHCLEEKLNSDIRRDNPSLVHYFLDNRAVGGKQLTMKYQDLICKSGYIESLSLSTIKIKNILLVKINS